jgi:hypothetical protein
LWISRSVIISRVTEQGICVPFKLYLPFGKSFRTLVGSKCLKWDVAPVYQEIWENIHVPLIWRHRYGYVMYVIIYIKNVILHVCIILWINQKITFVMCLMVWTLVLRLPLVWYVWHLHPFMSGHPLPSLLLYFSFAFLSCAVRQVVTHVYWYYILQNMCFKLFDNKLMIGHIKYYLPVCIVPVFSREISCFQFKKNNLRDLQHV